jgi:hypothetical protein
MKFRATLKIANNMYNTIYGQNLNIIYYIDIIMCKIIKNILLEAIILEYEFQLNPTHKPGTIFISHLVNTIQYLKDLNKPSIQYIIDTLEQIVKQGWCL